MLSDLRYRLRALFSCRAVEADMDDELRFHIERQSEEYRKRGLTPEEAARRARLDFGGVQQISEECRDARGARWVEDLFRDIRYALRGVGHSPFFAAVAVLSLALGIGANAAIFSVVNALLLKPLPVRDPARLVTIGNGENGSNLTYALWQQVHQNQDVCSQTFAWSPAEFGLASGGEKQPVRGLYVSGDYFAALGVSAGVGRVLSEADDRRGGPPVAVLSYDFWQSRYGGDPNILGRFIPLDGHPFQIVGVTARGFFGMEVGDRFDVVVPIGSEPLMHPERPQVDQKRDYWISIAGRLKTDVDLARATARLNVLAPPMFRALFPGGKHDPAKPYFSLRSAATGTSYLRDQYRGALMLLMGMVGLVLLIACANIANLLLSRARSRAREVAVRLAIGAGRGRLVRQFLAESLLLSVAGTAVGVVLAQFASRLLVVWISSSRNTHFLDLSTDGRVMAFTAALAALTGLLFGLAPALRATRQAPQFALKEGARGLTESQRGLNLSRVLVVAQVAISLVLVVGAGLFARSLQMLLRQDIGFSRYNVLLVDPDLRAAQYSRERQSAVSADLLDRLRQLPGVISAARSVVTPISGRGWQWDVQVDTPSQGQRTIRSLFNLVSPGFFQNMNTPIRAGRDFTAADTAKAPLVAIVNETAANRLFPGANPIGQTYGDELPDHTKIRVQVAGIVKDTKYQSLRDEPRVTIYLPITQNPAPFQVNGIYELRFAGPLPDVTSRVKDVFRSADPRIELQFQLLSTQIDDSLLQERLVARLASFFGVLALLLASIGLYGVVAFAVVRRRSEIGIRMALGAQRGGIVWLVLRETAGVLAIGIGFGLVVAMACARLVRSMLFALSPADPPTLAAACLLLLLVSVAAAYLPARKATRLDPLTTLREE